MIKDCIIPNCVLMQWRSWETGHSCMFTFCKTYPQSSSMYVHFLICSTNMAFLPKVTGDANYIKIRLPNWATNSWEANVYICLMLNHGFQTFECLSFECLWKYKTLHTFCLHKFSQHFFISSLEQKHKARIIQIGYS